MPNRDPVKWTLEASNDGGSTWNVVDDTYAAEAFNPTTTRFTWQGPFFLTSDAGAPGCGGQNLVTNGELDGPVTDNMIDGWSTHNAAVSVDDKDGRTGVIKVADAGGFSDIYQTLETVVGQVYTVSYDVWATPIYNTASQNAGNWNGEVMCVSTDSNGLLNFREGTDQTGTHGEAWMCPQVDAGWSTVTGTYTATGPQTTIALHGESSFTAWFDRVSITTGTTSMVSLSADDFTHFGNSLAGDGGVLQVTQVTEAGGQSGFASIPVDVTPTDTVMISFE